MQPRTQSDPPVCSVMRLVTTCRTTLVTYTHILLPAYGVEPTGLWFSGCVDAATAADVAPTTRARPATTRPEPSTTALSSPAEHRALSMAAQSAVSAARHQHQTTRAHTRYAPGNSLSRIFSGARLFDSGEN